MITVTTLVKRPLNAVWKLWTLPEQITKWNFAHESWCCPHAEIELVEGGRFSYRMEALDGSVGFDFSGTFDKVLPYVTIHYTMDDGRKCMVTFLKTDGGTQIEESFDPEDQNPLDMQQAGWQAILDNFKNIAEQSEYTPLVLYKIEEVINAPASVIYDVLFGKATYPQWTAAFNPSSRCEGDWSEGSIMKFIGEDAEGNQGGMVSKVVKNIKNSYLSLSHIGMLEGEKEILEGPTVAGFEGSKEIYEIIGQDDKCLLVVSVDIDIEWKAYFEDTWPKAIALVKELSENR